MSAQQNLRDLVNRFVPSWLSDRNEEQPSFGFRLLWTMVLFVDGALEVMMQGSLAAVGRATPTALDYIGQARGLIRNQDESQEDYAVRLGTWIDRAKENGTSYRLALAIHDYLRSHPRVRIFTRRAPDTGIGTCLTVETDRTVTMVDEPDFDWDSVSHPERNDPDAPYWSDMWIVVYTRPTALDPIAQWPQRAGTFADLAGDDGFALGHGATKREIDALKGLIQLCKACHSLVRAVIWTSDVDRFVPGDPSSMPNGRWGGWSIRSGGSQVASDRDLTTCRYWEPR